MVWLFFLRGIKFATQKTSRFDDLDHFVAIGLRNQNQVAGMLFHYVEWSIAIWWLFPGGI
ncbi:hypothetical protein L4D76_26870 [Photobacterium sagamiensis]|uniref:hypothetical protein n=1 Tax=Photobacterium sagamiensis TaxID=2910241 RepID=UPI003D15332F